MSYNKALNEIASLLTQAGLPAGHCQDIAERLSTALGSYYDYRSGINSTTNIGGTGDEASSSYLNQFRAQEAGLPVSRNGRAGKDGIRGQNGWGAAGATGGDGQDGQDGQQGEAGQSGRDGRDGTSVGLKLQKEIDDLKKRVDELEKKSDKGNCPECCKGKFYKQSVCAILEQQANELKKIKKKLGLDTDPDNPDPDPNCCEELKKKIEEIEQKLSQTVECE
jgi:tetrahydromethanopterin S-methyltransferase subunit G